MIIGIQSDLDDIKKYLQKKGYSVIVLDGLTELVDVYIYYSEKVNGLLSKSEISNFDLKNDNWEVKGTFMINAKGKTINELEYMVNNKCYSSLGLL